MRLYDGANFELENTLKKTGTDTQTRTSGHGQTDSSGKDGQLVNYGKTDSYGQTVMEKTSSYGKDGQLWRKRAAMENTGSYGKDRHKVSREKKIFNMSCIT